MQHALPNIVVLSRNVNDTYTDVRYRKASSQSMTFVIPPANELHHHNHFLC